MKYELLCKSYELLEKTTKRLEKTYYVAKLLKETPDEDIEKVVLLLQGRAYPKWNEKKIGVASKLLIKALSIALGISQENIETVWKEKGDLGIAAEELVKKKRQVTLFRKELTLKKVFENIRKVAEAEGPGSIDRKISFIAELLTSASPIEARYIVRTFTEELRIGLGEGTIRDALAWAFLPAIEGIFTRCNNCKTFMPLIEKCLECNNKLQAEFEKTGLKTIKIENPEALLKEDIKNYDFIETSKAREIYNFIIEKIQNAIDISNDFAAVASLLRKKGLVGLEEIKLKVGHPIKVMLYQKAKDIDEAFERLGKPLALEYKYDGFRMEIHKKEDKIILFTRRLEDVTNQFPDVVETVKQAVNAREFILDSEVIGIDPKTKKWLPFQKISQRIQRKYNIDKMIKEIPVMVNVFDIMEYEGKTILDMPFKKRRKIIEKIVKPIQDKIMPATQIITSSKQEAEAFYKESLARGNEGIMAKNLEMPYKPGSRVGYGVKIKPTMETLDLVIVGAEWGTGKRAGWLSSFILACKDPETDNLLEVGKVGTGIKEKAEEGISFEQLTNMLRPLIVAEKGREVKLRPEIVVEVTYEEIQKSPNYNSGFALRFPRLIRIREDKSVDEINTIDDVKELFYAQRHRK